MAGRHEGGTTSMGVFNENNGIALPFPYAQQLQPKNDKAYSEGRQAAFNGADRDTNVHGTTIDAAILINQRDAWICWDFGWEALTGSFNLQVETAFPDA